MLDDKDSAYCKVAKLLYPVLSNANPGVFFLAFVLFCFVCLSVCFLFFFVFFFPKSWSPSLSKDELHTNTC